MVKRESEQNFKNHFVDFENQISQRIFYRFSKFLMFWKEETQLFQLNLVSIYEIFLQVGVRWRFGLFSLKLDLLTIQKLS